MFQEPITKCVPVFSCLEPNAHQLQSIISKIALIGSSSDGEDTSERFLDPRSNTTFKFDHLSLVRDVSCLRYSSYWGTYRKLLTRNRTSLIAPLSLFGASPPHPMSFPVRNYHRVALEASARGYLSSHFQDGTTSVFSSPDNPTVFVIQIIANRYNPSNFWYVTRIQHTCTITFTAVL